MWSEGLKSEYGVLSFELYWGKKIETDLGMIGDGTRRVVSQTEWAGLGCLGVDTDE